MKDNKSNRLCILLLKNLFFSTISMNSESYLITISDLSWEISGRISVILCGEVKIYAIFSNIIHIIQQKKNFYLTVWMPKEISIQMQLNALFLSIFLVSLTSKDLIWGCSLFNLSYCYLLDLNRIEQRH